MEVLAHGVQAVLARLAGLAALAELAGLADRLAGWAWLP